MHEVVESAAPSSERNLVVRTVIPEAQFNDLRQQFALRDEASVRLYLCKYPFLFPLLLEAKAQVTRFFGNETQPALQISVDPNDWAAQLFVVIPTRLNADAAFALFDQLDQEWWLEASERAEFRMNFTPEFI